LKTKKSIFHSPLHPNDTQEQTQGCRHTNPDICVNNMLENICAFTRADELCLKPPQSWPKQFLKLLKLKDT
jgi:hypothetical protein